MKSEIFWNKKDCDSSMLLTLENAEEISDVYAALKLAHELCHVKSLGEIVSRMEETMQFPDALKKLVTQLARNK